MMENELPVAQAHTARLRRLGQHLALWVVLGIVAAMALGATSTLTRTAAAESAAPSSAAAFLTVVPEVTPTPGAVECAPTLSADQFILFVGRSSTLTFEHRCGCPEPSPPGTVCDYYPFALASIDAPAFVTPTTPIFAPVPYEFEVTAVEPGRHTITVNYDGETEVEPPGVYIRRPLTASIEILVLDMSSTAEQVYIACDEFLTLSDPSPTVGDTIEVTFQSNCFCVPEDGPAPGMCSFAQHELTSISAPGFNVPDTPIGPPGPSTVQITAMSAGVSTVTMRYFGEDHVVPPGIGSPRYRQASAEVDVQPLLDPAAVTDVTIAHSCLAGNGRVDVNLVNSGAASATLRIEFEGLSPRQFDVVAGDWWRMPFTGRPDGSYELSIARNGVVVHSETIEVTCDTAVPAVGPSEVSIVTACRGGLGYLLFQVVNPTVASHGYVIQFDNVPNRSTTAAGFGQSVRAVTGRPDGDHAFAVRRDGVVISSGVVTVACP